MFSRSNYTIGELLIGDILRFKVHFHGCSWEIVNGGKHFSVSFSLSHFCHPLLNQTPFHLPFPSFCSFKQTNAAKYQYNSTKAIIIKNASSIKNTTIIGISRGSFRLAAPTLASFRVH